MRTLMGTLDMGSVEGMEMMRARIGDYLIV